jgi:hypothetical protein
MTSETGGPGVDGSAGDGDADAGGATADGADGADDAGSSLSRRTLLKSVGALSTVSLLASDRTTGATDDPWTVVALPDMQKYAANPSSLLSYAQAQTEWIASNVDSENIAFVSHEGDLVDDGSDRTEWTDIDGVMDTLDTAGVPYAATPGDHDWAIEEQRSSSTANYREFFGAARYQGYSWFGGSAPSDLSHYQLFSAGGYDFLHIDLEWEAPGSADDESTALGWAQSVMDDYPDRPTIVTTHSYLWDGDPPGRTTFVEENDGDGSSGERIWREIIEPNPQVFMVLCANFHEDSGSSNGEYHQVSTNSAGSEVYEMLANYQDYENGGNSWLRLVRFQPGGGAGGQDRIQVQTYAPVDDEFATDDSSEFSFDLDFDARFGSSGTSDPPESTDSVAFRQGSDGYTGTVDTYVRAAEPTANNATAATLGVDTSDPEGSGQDVHALVRFDDIVGTGAGQLPPDADVVEASLTLETTNRGDEATVHRMLEPWDDDDTWNDFGGGVQADGTEARSTSVATANPDSTGPTTVDVTASVQAWLGGASNYGWAFLPTGGDGWDFSSAEGSDPPSLTVRYTVPDGTDETLEGDADGDGDVDGDDVEAVQRHAAGYDEPIDEEAADVDGDGDVDIVDAAAIDDLRSE